MDFCKNLKQKVNVFEIKYRKGKFAGMLTIVILTISAVAVDTKTTGTSMISCMKSVSGKLKKIFSLKD